MDFRLRERGPQPPSNPSISAAEIKNVVYRRIASRMGEAQIQGVQHCQQGRLAHIKVVVSESDVEHPVVPRNTNGHFQAFYRLRKKAISACRLGSGRRTDRFKTTSDEMKDIGLRS